MKANVKADFTDAKIVYLPLERTQSRRPAVSCVVKKVGEQEYIAGISVCSLTDNFSKKFGRTLACLRMHSRKAISANSIDNLINQIYDKLESVHSHHPQNVMCVWRDIDSGNLKHVLEKVLK